MPASLYFICGRTLAERKTHAKEMEVTFLRVAMLLAVFAISTASDLESTTTRRALIAHLGCSKCKKFFPSGEHGLDYSGFEVESIFNQICPRRNGKLIKKLYEELKKRKNQGESNLVIRRGKIVPYVTHTYRTRIITNPVFPETNNRPTATAMASDVSTVSKPTGTTESDVSNDHEIRLDS